jgi:TonB-linked SusC/RagA family outer membrane protein
MNKSRVFMPMNSLKRHLETFLNIHKIVLIGLLLTISFNVGYAQEQNQYISGTVTDDAGFSLPGVTVYFKDTQVGTVTGIDGNFQLKIPEGKKIIIVSFIGMVNQEIDITGKTNIKVSMIAETTEIDQVVVTGYQKVDRKLFTGAASRVKMEDIKLGGETDITKSLEGRVAGVSVQNVSSTFGTAPKVRVRGSSSIYGTQKPLWVVDGIVLEDAKDVSMDDLSSGDLSTLISSGVAGLNMDDVADIQILSDGTATAIYGARAMNGVIVITTKKGKKGALNINYSNNITIRPKPRYEDYNILNSADQMSINRELYEKGWINVASTQTATTHGAYGKMFDLIATNQLNWVQTDDDINNYLRKYETCNTNWFKELFNTGVQQQHTLSISGGGEKATFYTSIGYLKDHGWTIADNVDRYTALLKGTFFISDKFRVTTQADLSYRDQELSGVSNSGGSGAASPFTGKISRNFDNNPFMYAMTTSRNIRAYDENGDKEFFRRNYVDYNIVDELSKNTSGVNVQDMTFRAIFDYDVNKQLKLNARIAARFFNATTTRKIHETSNEANAYRAGTRPGDSELIMTSNGLLYQRPGETTGVRYSILPEGGIYKENGDKMENYYINGSANWNPKIGDKHSFTSMLGAEMRYIDRSTSFYNGYGHFYDMGNLSKPSANYLEYLEMTGGSYFGNSGTFERFIASMLNVGYSYLGRYTLNGTVRYEGSNGMGKSRDARWMPSWTISGKWALQEEGFLKDKQWLDQLSLRAGYSLTGSRAPASNSTVLARAYNPSRPFHPGSSETAIGISQLENASLTYEKLYELNVGVDFAAWRNRLSVSANYYDRRSFDLIGQYQTNGVGGEKTKWGNVADMDSYGYELSVNASVIRAKDWNWNTGVTFSYHESEITNLLKSNWVGSATSIYGVPVLNGPVRGIYSTRFAGLDDEGVPTFYNRNNEKVRYLNVQTTDFSDFKYSGNLEPTTQLGLSNTFKYKNVTLSTLISGQFGHVKRVMNDYGYSYNDSQALNANLKNRWKVKGDEQRTNIPAILDKDRLNREDSYMVSTAYNLYGMSDYWIADASFIRLKNVSLNYQLPTQWLKAVNLSSASISVQGTNLANLWLADRDKLGGEDPEFVWSGGTTMPITKQYTFSLKIGF